MNYKPVNCGFRIADCGIKTPNSEPPACQRTCSAGRRTPNSKGMTLIETIMVIVIIAILMAVVIPRAGFDVAPRASVEGAAHMIASDIRYAQEFAMANRVSKEIRFTANSNSYSFFPTSSLDPTGRLPSGITIGTTVTFRFNSLGEPISGGGSSVTVSGSGSSKTINVANYTGKVSIL